MKNYTITVSEQTDSTGREIKCRALSPLAAALIVLDACEMRGYGMRGDTHIEIREGGPICGELVWSGRRDVMSASLNSAVK